jgi:hypothetical protein
MIVTFAREVRGDTVSFVSPYKVITGLEINKRVIQTQTLYKIS